MKNSPPYFSTHSKWKMEITDIKCKEPAPGKSIFNRMENALLSFCKVEFEETF